MAWETRGGTRRYYTRSTRQEGRVVRKYVGQGEAGENAAAEDLNRRATRRAALSAIREERRRIAEADAHVTVLYLTAEVAAKAALLVAGFHRHARGDWRRRRV